MTQIGARCTAPRFGSHDYTCPPHNTVDDPLMDDGLRPSERCAGPLIAKAACVGRPSYRVVVYQAASHDWISILCCEPCVAALRARRNSIPGRDAQNMPVSPIHRITTYLPRRIVAECQ